VDFNLHIPANALLLAFAFGLLANPGIEQKSEVTRPIANRAPQFALAALSVILLVQCARLIPGEYYTEAARTALRDEDPTEAVALAKRGLGLERQNPNIFFYLGRALVALGNEPGRSADERNSFYNQALAAFENARRLVPLDGTYPLTMAHTYDRMKRFAEAEEMYQLAQARDPRSEAVTQLYQTHLDSWTKEKQDRTGE